MRDNSNYSNRKINQFFTIYNIILLVLLLILSYVNQTLSLSPSSSSSSSLSSLTIKKSNRSTYHGIKNILGGGFLGRNPKSQTTSKPASRIDPSESHHDPISEVLTSNDVSYISILSASKDNTITTNTNNETFSVDSLSTDSFGALFRQCAPYIAMHRGSIMVIHLGGHILQNRQTFDAMMDDISILHLLGVQLVLIAGVRNQMDERLISSGHNPVYHQGMRITTDEGLRVLKEVSGFVRYEVESSLARGFRGRPGQSGINVVSGNFFYSAKPLGVRDGVDYKFTGEVRRVEVENLKQRLQGGDLIMLTSLGYSPSGEVFNVPSESLAADVAAKLQASKLIYLTEGESLIDNRSGKTIQSFRLAQAMAFLDQCGIQRNSYNVLDPDAVVNNENKGEVADSNYGNSTSVNASGFLQQLARCVHALLGGVTRAHLIAPVSGCLLKELFTRDGAGMLISRDVYEGIRQAQAKDVRSVQEIITPLEEEGILVPRSRDQLEKDMSDCFLVTREDTVLACGMLKRYSDSHAEVCCLAVHPRYRKEGRGETLLAYLERRALLMGVTDLFVLSTRTMQWFEERGFVLSDPELLPSTRNYNKSRGSKVYMKKLGSQRDIDAEELLWNVGGGGGGGGTGTK